MASGFSVANYWVTMYNIVADSNVKLNSSQKLRLNNTFRVIKDTWNLSGEDMKALIRFMYMHNPLGFEYMDDYGNIDCLNPVAAKFVEWKRYNKNLIASAGYVRAITQTIPKNIEIDDEIMKDLDSLVYERN